MKSILIFCTLIFTLICFSQSRIIVKKEFETLRTLDIEFLLKALPDNGWILKLKKDSTYEYIHFSGWGSEEGKILEKGKYYIKGKTLKLKLKTKYKELKSRKFIFAEKGINEIDDLKIDCKESEKKIYCLYEINN